MGEPGGWCIVARLPVIHVTPYPWGFGDRPTVSGLNPEIGVSG
jgi:hypothetical protein